MADAQAQESKPEPKSSGKKLIILGALAFLTVGGAAAGGAYYLGLQRSAQSSPAVAEGSGPTSKVPKEALYVALHPAFTVNFPEGEGTRFLQLSLEAMTRDPVVEELIEKHMPVIRNRLMLIFSGQSSARLGTREGKERLRKETLAAIQTVLEEQAGNAGVDEVYFTSFVMQ